MKFKVLDVREGIGGVAHVTVEYADGRTATFGMTADEDIAERAKKHYEITLEWERKASKAVKHAKQFEGKELSF